jgi:hypothetical protein
MEEVTMRRCGLEGLIISVVAGAAMVACSGQSLVGLEAVEAPRSAVQALPGTYTLSFVSGGQTVTSLPVGSEVALKAEVTDAFGAPAQSGRVTWVVARKDGGSSNRSNTVSADELVSLP